MSATIIASLISGVVSLVGTVITVLVSSHKTAASMRTSQAVMDTKIDELTREVREHNNFARRMPVLEEKIKVINHRLNDLEENK